MEKPAYYRLSKRVNNSFKRAIEKKGYLSLCAIIESQFKYPFNSDFKPRRQTALRKVEVSAPGHCNLREYNLKIAKGEVPRPSPEVITLESRIKSAKKILPEVA